MLTVFDEEYKIVAIWREVAFEFPRTRVTGWTPLKSIFNVTELLLIDSQRKSKIVIYRTSDMTFIVMNLLCYRIAHYRIAQLGFNVFIAVYFRLIAVTEMQ